MPKRTVLDPQGQTIQHALFGLGYAQVKDVRQGKFFVLNLDGWNREEAQKELERKAQHNARLSAQPIFILREMLQHLSQPTAWHALEHALKARSLEVDDLSQDVIRCDATTVSGAHEVTEEGWVQVGQSKEEPTRPQLTVMMGS